MVKYKKSKGILVPLQLLAKEATYIIGLVNFTKLLHYTLLIQRHDNNYLEVFFQKAGRRV